METRQPCAVDRVQLAQENEVRVLTGAGSFSVRIIVDATGRASWFTRRLGIPRGGRSWRLIARYGCAAGFCSAVDEAPELVGDAKGWVWTAMVQPGLYQWTRVAADGSLPHPGWLPLNLRRLTPVGPSRGADVTWRMAAHTAHPAWFIVGDAVCRLDPLSSKGVLRAMMSGIAAGHPDRRAALDGRIAADAAAKCTSTGCPSDLYGRPCIWRHSIGSSGLPASAADADIEVRYE